MHVTDWTGRGFIVIGFEKSKKRNEDYGQKKRRIFQVEIEWQIQLKKQLLELQLVASLTISWYKINDRVKLILIFLRSLQYSLYHTYNFVYFV